MATPGSFVAGVTLTAAEMNLLPGGRIGSASVTADQGSVGTAATDWTGLSVTFTAIAGRRYKISINGGLGDGTGASQIAALYIRKSTTVVGGHFQGLTGASQVLYGSGWVIITDTGSVTYKVSGNFTTGAANSFKASAALPASILVEDIGV